MGHIESEQVFHRNRFSSHIGYTGVEGRGVDRGTS